MTSKPSIGFLLITHRFADQVAHLCARLGEMFLNPPIVIHHDFFQEPLDKARFSENVHFVEPPVLTGWGTFGVVQAQLAALELMVKVADPDWIVLLSSADYPIKTAERIRQDLAETRFDAFIDSRPIQDLGVPYHDGNLGDFPFAHSLYSQTAFNRYVAYPLLTRKLATRLRTARERWVVKWLWLCARTSPFHDGVRCYAGDAWFTINRRVARFLLTDSPLRQRLFAHYSNRASPEESIYQTLLGNSSEFQLAPVNLRYTDWTGCYAHPRTLGREDIPMLLASSDHFARKFPFDTALLEELETRVKSAAAMTEPFV